MLQILLINFIPCRFPLSGIFAGMMYLAIFFNGLAMPLFLPPDYLHSRPLIERGVTVSDTPTAGSISVAIVNIMPQAESYEFLLLHRLGASIFGIEPCFFRVKNHRYQSSDSRHLQRYYHALDQLPAHHPDAVILTGAPVEHLPKSQITYYPEIEWILNICHGHQIPLLGICWGAITVAGFWGIKSKVLEKKVSGVYQGENLEPNHSLLAGIGNVTFCPQSRFASLDETDVKQAAERRIAIRLLALADGGTYLLQSADGLLTAHLGHPEYLAERILYEYQRDILSNPEVLIHGFDPANPADTWSADAQTFFNNWLAQLPSATKPKPRKQADED